MLQNIHIHVCVPVYPLYVQWERAKVAQSMYMEQIDQTGNLKISYWYSYYY